MQAEGLPSTPGPTLGAGQEAAFTPAFSAPQLIYHLCPKRAPAPASFSAPSLPPHLQLPCIRGNGLGLTQQLLDLLV